MCSKLKLEIQAKILMVKIAIEYFFALCGEGRVQYNSNMYRGMHESKGGWMENLGFFSSFITQSN